MLPASENITLTWAASRSERAASSSHSLYKLVYGNARMPKEALKQAEGLKAGLLRPITLWPFPYKPLRDKAGRGRKFIAVEDSLGQMVDDVKMAVEGKSEVCLADVTFRHMPSEEGMILAVRNFRAIKNESERYTLSEIASIRPEHFGLRGLSDQSYYPMQFEIIQQSVRDWDSNDKSTMMIQVQAIPINYDLVITDKGEPEYVKGFSYPIVGEETHILNQDMIHQMYNRKILEEMGIDWKKLKTTEVAREDPRSASSKCSSLRRPEFPST
jgi:hypothetical protein